MRHRFDENHALSAPAERVDALISGLAGRFAAAAETRTYSERYRLGRNSNHRLAAAARQRQQPAR
jgi:hypothetical protein